MGHYKIDIANTEGFFSIASEEFHKTKWFLTKRYSYGCDLGEDSSLAIVVDNRTQIVLAISCMAAHAIESAHLYDEHEFDTIELDEPIPGILSKLKNAYFITPEAAVRSDYAGYDYIDNFCCYFSKEMLMVLLAEGEAAYYYADDRLRLYYDDSYDLLTILILELTEEELESLRAKKS